MDNINGIRFIVGSGCNYKCFYCHHEGFEESKKHLIDNDKLFKLLDYCKYSRIFNISITGGEPFLYYDNTKMILDAFSEPIFKKTINTNASLIHNYFDELSKLHEIEFHINYSSLKRDIHRKRRLYGSKAE